MEQNLHFKIVSRSLNFDLEFLNPFKMKNQNQVLSRRFLAICILLFSAPLVSATYAIDSFYQLSFTDLVNVAIFFVMFCRFNIYLWILIGLQSQFAKLVNKMINDRKCVKEDSDIWQLTLIHCKNEFNSLVVMFAPLVTLTPCFIFGGYWLPNHLFYNFIIIWLPFKGISLNWFLNYCYQTAIGLPGVTVFFTYSTMTLLLVNHSCWKLDTLIATVAKCKPGAESKKFLKEIITESVVVLQWLSEVQNCLVLGLMVDFTSQPMVLCCSLYSMTIDLSGSYIALGIAIATLSQLFIYCWMGTRIKTRIETNSAAVYDLHWYEMHTEERKDFLKILLMSQNMKGINGVFKEVNMETFQKILEFAYSAFALLKSTT